MCNKSENAWVCAKWQWNALDWCYWIVLPASPVVQSSKLSLVRFTVILHTPMRSRYIVPIDSLGSGNPSRILYFFRYTLTLKE